MSLDKAAQGSANTYTTGALSYLSTFVMQLEGQIAHLLVEHERKTGRLVPRRATLHDVGTGLTHKRIICWKRFAEGKEPDQIARETYHSLEAVDRYLGQYDRVRHCRLQGMSTAETAHVLDCTVRLVEEYLAIDCELEKRNA